MKVRDGGLCHGFSWDDGAGRTTSITMENKPGDEGASWVLCQSLDFF